MNSKSKKTLHKRFNTDSRIIRLFIYLYFVLFLLLSLTLFTAERLHAQTKETELEEMFAIFSEEEIVVSAMDGIEKAYMKKNIDFAVSLRKEVEPEEQEE